MPNALSLSGGTVRAVHGEKTLSLEYQLVSGRLAGYSSLHKEYDYTDGDLTSINVWDSAAKLTQIFSYILSYTDGDLTQKVVTDHINSQTLTVTYGYTNGDLTSVTEVISWV
jgi:hypothetical protein